MQSEARSGMTSPSIQRSRAGVKRPMCPRRDICHEIGESLALSRHSLILTYRHPPIASRIRSEETPGKAVERGKESRNIGRDCFPRVRTSLLI
jgi:hypothetical protein